MRMDRLIARLATAALWALTSVASVQAQAKPAATPDAHKPSYHFSPVNQHSLALSAKYWNPILDYVSTKSGVQLSLRLGRTSAETTSVVLAGEADFAFTNHLFSPDRAKLGWKVFGRRAAPPVQGQLIVPADSPIQSLADLRGKSVAFPGAEALVSYKVTVAELINKKIEVIPVFAGNLDAAFMQMVSGRADAMGTNSHMVSEYTAREGRAFRVLWSSQPFNDLALMASARVPAAQVQAVAQAFLSMHLDPVGKQVLLASAQVVQAQTPVSFAPANDADYAAYRHFYRHAPAALR